MSILMTQKGIEKAELYIAGLKEKRKEILDAGKDTAVDTPIPSVSDIASDVEEFQSDGEYWNTWGVTDKYDADTPLHLEERIDYYMHFESLSMGYHTRLGLLSANTLIDEDDAPGFAIMLKPDGWDEEIDICCAFVDNEDKKIHIATWGDPSTEDCTSLVAFGKKELDDAREELYS